MLGSGFLLYAFPAAAGSPLPADANTSSGSDTSRLIYFHLVPVASDVQSTNASGHAGLSVGSGSLSLEWSISGASPGERLTMVMQAGDRSFTFDSVTVSEQGTAGATETAKLDPGVYSVGLKVTNSTSGSGSGSPSPVFVSDPATAQVTIGSSQAPPVSTAVGDALSYTLVPLPVYLNHEAPDNYPFREGGALIVLSGDTLAITMSFQGSRGTSFDAVLQTNDRNITLGSVATSSTGAAVFKGNLTLDAGTYQIGLLLFPAGKTDSPVAVSVPRVIGVTLGSSSTSAATSSASAPSTSSTRSEEGSSSRTTSAESGESHSATSSGLSASTSLSTSAEGSSTTRSSVTASPPGENETGGTLTFTLVPSKVENVPEGYRFASSGTATVSLDDKSMLLNVDVEFDHGNPSTTYTVALSLNGTSSNLGTMTTNRGGAAVLHSSIQAGPGTYLLGIVVYDVSDIAAFHASGPVPVMVGSPATRTVVIGPSSGTSQTSSSAASRPEGESSHSVPAEVTKAARTISAGTEVQSQILSEVDNLTIPATVHVTPLNSTTTVFDSRFSLSVGQQAGDGLVVAISGENVTGPRVLLINISRTSPLSLYPALNVTLDGAPVAEASSALQVLQPTSSNPPLYVLVSTSDSVQLLVSIPHFSLHLIQVAGVVLHNIETSIELDAPVLLGSIVAISLAFAGAYAARKRYFAL